MQCVERFAYWSPELYDDNGIRDILWSLLEQVWCSLLPLKGSKLYD